MLINNPVLHKVIFSIKLVGTTQFIECAYTRFVDLNPELIEWYRITVYDTNGTEIYRCEFDHPKTIQI